MQRVKIRCHKWGQNFSFANRFSIIPFNYYKDNRFYNAHNRRFSSRPKRFYNRNLHSDGLLGDSPGEEGNNSETNQNVCIITTPEAKKDKGIHQKGIKTEFLHYHEIYKSCPYEELKSKVVAKPLELDSEYCKKFDLDLHIESEINVFPDYTLRPICDTPGKCDLVIYVEKLAIPVYRQLENIIK